MPDILPKIRKIQNLDKPKLIRYSVEWADLVDMLYELPLETSIATIHNFNGECWGSTFVKKPGGITEYTSGDDSFTWIDLDDSQYSAMIFDIVMYMPHE